MPLSNLRVFLGLLAFRVLNAALVATFFQPDADWQGPEIAHRLVYGYGYRTWEWRPEVALRSPLGALVYVPAFALARLLGDRPELVVLLPRVTQGLIAATNDWATWRLARIVLGLSAQGLERDRAALVCTVLSLANASVTARTFSNSLETALTALALSCWPWPGVKGNIRIALGLAAVACIVRPSNAVIWIILGLHRLRVSPATGSHILAHVSFIGLVAAVACFALDSWFYRRPTFTPLNFLRVNVVHNISVFYGSNPAHFYLSQALPFLSFTQLPFVINGVVMRAESSVEAQRVRILLAAILAMVGVHTALAHKEIRFVQPLLPILHVLAARSLSSFSLVDRRVALRRTHIIALAATSLPAIVYLIRWHCVGQVAVVDALRTMPEIQSVGFLMPCHSTPWQSRLHRADLETPDGSGTSGRLCLISCEPPISGQDHVGYRDQSDFFYEDPARYLLDRFPSTVDPTFPPSIGPTRLPTSVADDDLAWRHEWPSHIALFDVLLGHPDVATVLAERGYVERARFWNAHWTDDERRRGDVVVLAWRGSAEAQDAEVLAPGSTAEHDLSAHS